MKILQIILLSRNWQYQIGIVAFVYGNDSCVTKVGNYGYHPHLQENTLQHFGNFYLELIK